MADHNNQELIYLRHAVVRLANEIDYKNHLLMEKEGLSLDRFASMSSLIEEKDRLLDERSAVIGSLMAQKHRLHEVFVEETRKCVHLKQEMKNLRHELEVQQQKLDTRNIEQEEFLALNDKGPGIVTVNSTNGNGCLESPEINPIDSKHDNKLLDSMNKLQHLRTQNEDQKAQLEKLKNELNEKGEALHQLEILNQTLVLNERSSNEELKDARMEAIKCLLTLDGNESKVGIKRIGEIDPQPFRDVCSKKLCSRNWEEESDELYTLWQENVKDPSWNPFKKEIQNGQVSEIVDEKDKKLVELKEEWGEEPSKAVASALLDLKKYNPSLSSIPELWNFEEGRRVYLKEVIQYMIQQWEVNRNKVIEKSEDIIELMEEKQKLLQELASLNILMEEKDKVLKQKYAAVSKLIAQDMEKDKLIGQLSVAISTLKAEKHALLESCNSENITMKCMKEQTERLKQELQSQEELAKQTEESETKQHNCGGDKSVTIKEDSTEWYLDSLTEQVGPITEKLKKSQFHKTKEQISSTSENKKFQGQDMGEMLKLSKAELGMLGKLSDGRWDVLEVLKTSTHSNFRPSKALVPSPSDNSIALERFFQTANVKKEDE